MASPNRYVGVVVLAADVRCGATAEQNRRSSALRASREIEHGVHEIDLLAASRPPRPLEAPEPQALVCVCDRRCRVLCGPLTFCLHRARHVPPDPLSGRFPVWTVRPVRPGWHLARKAQVHGAQLRCQHVLRAIVRGLLLRLRGDRHHRHHGLHGENGTHYIEYSGIE